MALGAQSRDVPRLILRQGMSLAALGSVIGLGAAFAGTRLLSSLLYGVDAHDLVHFQRDHSAARGRCGDAWCFPLIAPRASIR
ncbi:MAG: hypothetical protein DLM52_08615 [Chthoniobacterales bacterium]|nr:MAG: hypothetical protein DLM52_08615 [Chthoniobacterales bacterium]